MWESGGNCRRSSTLFAMPQNRVMSVLTVIRPQRDSRHTGLAVKVARAAGNG